MAEYIEREELQARLKKKKLDRQISGTPKVGTMRF